MIALPIVVQNLLNFGVSAADTIMVGQLGEVQLSAVAVSSQMTFLYMISTFGVAAGCGVLAAQHWGAGNKEKVREIIAFMFRIMAAVSLGFAAVAFLIPHHVLGFIIDDPEVIAEGVRYLRVLSVGYLFFGTTTAGLVILRSTGTVKIAMLISLCSLVISVVLNYLLIFGNFGFPTLGVVGAATATSIAWGVGVILLVIYLFKVEKNVAFRPRYLLRRGEGIAKSFGRFATPVLFNEIGWGAANFMLGVIVGRMGREFVAANSIGQLVVQFVGVVIFGVAGASAAIMGNTIGAGEKEKAKQYANGMLILSLGLGVVSFFVVQGVRLPLIGLYEISDTARIYAEQITHVISGNMIFLSIAAVAIIGTLRGGGDTKFAALVDIIFVWLVAIPLGAFTGLRLGWPVWAVYIILRSEDVFKSVLILWRIRSGKWIKDVTKK